MSEPAPDPQPPRPRGRPKKDPSDLIKLPPHWCDAVREVIQAARFQKKPPLKLIAARLGLNHQRLKTYYCHYRHGRVDLSRGDTTLAEKPQIPESDLPKFTRSQAMTNREQAVEMARSLHIYWKMNKFLNDQLEVAMETLGTLTFKDRKAAFRDLGIEDFLRLKTGLIKLAVVTEKGFLTMTEARVNAPPKRPPAQQSATEPEKEVEGKVVNTVVNEIERFHSAFETLNATPPEATPAEA